MRLTDVKTRAQTGFDYVLRCLDIRTPYGKKEMASVFAFAPGKEQELISELDKLQQMTDLVISERKRKTIEIILEIFNEMNDVTFSISRSKEDILSVVEIFEIKSLLLQMRRTREILNELCQYVPHEWMLSDMTPLLDALDPRGDRINTFYLYDEFSETLAGYRTKKHVLEKEIRKEQKIIRQTLEKEHGISLTPKFDLVIAKSNSDLLQKAEAISELEKSEEDYMSATFTIKVNDNIYDFQREIENIEEKIDEEELRVRERLSKTVGSYADSLIADCDRLGKLDFALAKARYAIEHHCVKPNIEKEHMIRIRAGRQLEAEDMLSEKGKPYCPVDIDLDRGVTCITGANMGGKTVSLKLIGLVALLAQHGFFVPCKEAQIGLSNYIHILVGDSQSMQRGLSSFGGEMEELKDILDHSVERSLILIDEIASGTNPVEGLALICGIIDYMLVNPYIVVLTTHFDHAADDRRVRNLQVRGLADADFDKLKKEIRYANRKERIAIIAKYMDYRLYAVENDKQIPKDALNIAQMLGVYPEIINSAKDHMKR